MSHTSRWCAIYPEMTLYVGDIVTPGNKRTLYMVVGTNGGSIYIRALSSGSPNIVNEAFTRDMYAFGWLCSPLPSAPEPPTTEELILDELRELRKLAKEWSK